jgi:hypothetical protein
MPLRDHFRPPVDLRMSWEGFHSMWPANMATRLMQRLPEGYIAEAGNHMSTQFEVDVAGYEQENWTDGAGEEFDLNSPDVTGGTATAVETAIAPTVSVVTDLDQQDEYEVRVYDQHRARRLVAVVELVSPANKDRPESRQALVTKCAAFLQQGVSVCLIDLVTTRHFNIYAELSVLLNVPAPIAARPDALYGVACRGIRRRKQKMVFQAWPHELHLGQPLPTLPLWLTRDLWVPLELEESYEEICRTYRLPLPAPTSPPPSASG